MLFMIKIICSSAAAVAGLLLIRKFRDYTWGKCKSSISLKNKTFIITGANCGIGKATALELSKRGARVILACRDQEKAHRALTEIRSQSGIGVLRVMYLDLASFRSIKRFSDEFVETEERLDVLINNAAVYYCPYATTADGYEMQLGVNHLGHFLLTRLLLEKLKQSAPARVVILTSALYRHGRINFDTLNSETYYDRAAAYSNSKLANALFCRELSRRLYGTGVDVYAVSPGMAWTQLGRHRQLSWWQLLLLVPVAWLFVRSPRQAAQTVLHCATSEDVAGESGFIYRDCQRTAYVALARDEELVKRMWDMSDIMCRKLDRYDRGTST